MPGKPRLGRQGVAPKTGIVHFGPGAFFRAFNAIYTDEVIQQLGGDWGITAVSLRSSTFRDQLEPQRGCYTAVSLGSEGAEYRVVNAVSSVLVAPEDPNVVLDTMIDPSVRIVSLTITEKGYCHNPATGILDPEHPDIRHDLANLATPRSAIGFIVAALQTRRAASIAPFTVMSCDNLPSNGQLVHGVVLDFAKRVDVELAAWIEANVTFPSTMVDRITPATTGADVEALAEAKGYFDPACVVHEPFRQWVIEDNFVDGRPAWEDAGAQFVQSVEAHELMKLRCLNGTHSSLAYLGYLAGHETVANASQDPLFSGLCEKLWSEEILPTLPQPEGENLEDYAKALLVRYQNPSIRHRLWQIAMDGSQKLPQRILGTIRDALALGNQPDGLCLAVAAWMRYVGAVDEQGNPIDVRDPLAANLKAASDSVQSPSDKVATLLAMSEVFDPELAGDVRFRTAVTDAYETLAAQGAVHAVGEYLG